MKHFKATLAFDESMWTARIGMARIHAQRHEYTEAIDPEKTNVKFIEDQLKKQQELNLDDSSPDYVEIDDTNNSYRHIARYDDKLNDPLKSLQYYLKAIDAFNRD